MAGPTTQVLSEDPKSLTREVSASRAEFASEFAGFRSQVNTQLGVIKWLGVFFAGILVSLFGGIVNLAWNASALNSEVKQQGIRLDRLEKNSDAILLRLERIDGRLETLGARLDEDNRPRKEPGKAGE
jgi:hypothetical protein